MGAQVGAGGPPALRVPAGGRDPLAAGTHLRTIRDKLSDFLDGQ
jgi:hypothetical protein